MTSKIDRTLRRYGIRYKMMEVLLPHEVLHDRALKEQPHPILCGKSPRYALQTLGTEWRDLMGRELWANIWKAKASAILADGDPVVVDDLRHAHEVKMVLEMGGTIVFVHRPGCGPQDHPSEQMQEIEKVARLHLKNDETPQNLFLLMKDWLISEDAG